MSLLAEALIVAIVLVIISLPILRSIRRISPGANQDAVFAATIAVSGALAHLLFEATGINRAYCTHGHACAISRDTTITHPAAY